MGVGFCFLQQRACKAWVLGVRVQGVWFGGGALDSGVRDLRVLLLVVVVVVVVVVAVAVLLRPLVVVLVQVHVCVHVILTVVCSVCRCERCI